MARTKNTRKSAQKGSTASIRRQVIDIIGSRAETKKYAQVTGSNTASSTGTVFTFTQNIAQGDDVFNRNGDQIFLLSLRLEFTGLLPALAVAGGLRIIIFSDRYGQGVVPAVTDVLQTAAYDSTLSITQSIANRYKIWMDKFYSMTVGSNQEFHAQIQRTINKKVSYLGGAAVAGSNGMNSLYMIVITDLAANQPTFRYGLELTYRDS